MFDSLVFKVRAVMNGGGYYFKCLIVFQYAIILGRINVCMHSNKYSGSHLAIAKRRTKKVFVSLVQ